MITDERTDNGSCRVAFATENYLHKSWDKKHEKVDLLQIINHVKYKVACYLHSNKSFSSKNPKFCAQLGVCKRDWLLVCKGQIRTISKFIYLHSHEWTHQLCQSGNGGNYKHVHVAYLGDWLQGICYDKYHIYDSFMNVSRF